VAGPMIEASSLYTVTPEQAQENLLMELAAELGYATNGFCGMAIYFKP